jgi:hypothetical protein
VLQLLTTDDFADWFASLSDSVAEDVATAIDVIERLGPERAAPGSRELLLWYEHPAAARFEVAGSFAHALEAWAGYRDYAERVLEQLQSHRFVSRVASLPASDGTKVLDLIGQIKRHADPRARLTLRSLGLPVEGASGENDERDPCAELRRSYLAALALAGLEVTDVPAHSLALRELATRVPTPGFRLLYGVNVVAGVALVVLGERLDRRYYGDSVRRAERAWKRFLEGDLRGRETPALRR